MKRRSSVNSVENIVHSFASDTVCVNTGTTLPICDQVRSASEPDIGYSVNYDDLCGPWHFPANPAHVRNDSPPTPQLCVWQFLTPENMACMKASFEDEGVLKLLLEKKIFGEGTPITGRDIFVELALSIIKFTRANRFTEESTSALLGIFHLTYSYFLSNHRRTAEETYEFFYATLLLHAVEDPPKSLEILTPEECALSLEFFSAILMTHLPLVRFVSLPNYCCIVPDNLAGARANQ